MSDSDETKSTFIETVTSYTTDEWCTPKWLADDLGEFDLDPCSNPRSYIDARKTYQVEREEDGLLLPWSGSVFCNPPYSDVMPWAVRLVAHSGPWVALVKLDTTTKWWSRLMSSRGVRWAPFRCRLKFEQPGKSQTANFASALVWSRWHPSDDLAGRLWISEYSAQVPT